jgi:hypothetical protein
LQKCALLGQFFSATMKQTNMRIRPLDDFTI